MGESTLVYGCHVARNGYRGQTAAILKSGTFYSCYVVGESDCTQIHAHIKCHHPNAGHTLRNSYGGQTTAVIKCPLLYSGHALRNGYGGNTIAISKCRLSDGCYSISFSVVYDRFGDNDRTRISAIQGTATCSHRCCSYMSNRFHGSCRLQIIKNSINLDIMRI